MNQEMMIDRKEILKNAPLQWLLEGTPTARMQADVEPKGKPSKWITLIALRTQTFMHNMNVKGIG